MSDQNVKQALIDAIAAYAANCRVGKTQKLFPRFFVAYNIKGTSKKYAQ